MRYYEIATILKLDLDESSLSGITEKIESWIADAGGDVAARDNWGRRKLAYPINKQYEGHYVFWHASLPTTAVAELERQMRLNEEILRFMVIRTEILPAKETEMLPHEEEQAEAKQGKDESTHESDVAGGAHADSGSDLEELVNSEQISSEEEGAESGSVV